MTKAIRAGGVPIATEPGTVAAAPDAKSSARPLTYSGEPELSGFVDENSDPVALFHLWYYAPLMKLDRDAGFIALGTSCWLYERYVCALRKAECPTADADMFMIQQLAADFDIDPGVAETFWNVIRNGLLHQGMPKRLEHGKPLTQWELSGAFTVAIAFNASAQRLEVEPLLFRDKVLTLYVLRPDLIAANRSFLWGRIYTRPMPVTVVGG